MRRNTSIDLLAKIDPSVGLFSCWPFLGCLMPNGHGRVKRVGRNVLPHRWSYEHHYGVKLDSQTIIRHKCDNPACCNPLHLEPGTQADNVRDRDERGRQYKISEAELARMHQLRAAGWTQSAIGKELGWHQATISIWLRKSSA